ncbi:TonB-dependent receptor plug domain-containing protein [Roseateles cellulosilyticus]|uniref:TonB-dependent receptor n=1 Tax=Pelomonas cellulosilytica TaxID=2906762 RepID=A0ABS8XV45_9BURK|nr:TonB-dependent receptor [Pelomonas sp. P8]MCE4556532.1 TonB-dependent receptor [Pelomonas sp. P8]
MPLPIANTPSRLPFPASAAGCAAALLAASLAQAQGADAPERIGTVTITGTQPRSADTATATQLREADALTTGAALELVPGVVQSKVGARNEQMAYVRGFDLRQVPVFVDGVPIYVPYDGYVDLGRFTTFDLAAVQVDKGLSSMLYGANTLGGAINLVGRRPTRPLELEGGSGLEAGRQLQLQSHWAYANLGLRQERFYAQASVSGYGQSAFDLPAGFTATKAEDGGARENSWARDRKYALKLGWLPQGGDARDEVSLNVIDQHGTKGTPPYAGNVAGVTPRYWRWPYWDKQSLYLLSRTALGAHTLTLRVFRDTFRNSLFTYDDATYTTQKKPSSFQSWYDDFSNGASAQLDVAAAPGNTLGMAAHWKRDIHREHNAGEPVRHFDDTTQSLALEDSQQLGEHFTLVAGLGHDTRRTSQAQDYNSSTKAVSEFAHGDGGTTNGQLALLARPSEAWQWRASLARKSRFPTIKDRYSYRLGTALPNAALKPERATHAELAATITPWAGLQFDAAVFASHIDDLIQSVTIATACGANACVQAQNIGRARARGAELGWDWKAGAWRLDGHYQWLDRRNLSAPTVRLTDTPRQQLLAHVAWRVLPAVTLHASAKAASMRWSSSDSLQRAAGFGLADLKAQWQANPQLSLEAGVHNLNDRLYAYADGYPEPGRQWLLQAHLKLR